jgi:hypothetical protein
MIDWAQYEDRLTELVSAPEEYPVSIISKILSEENGISFSEDSVRNKIKRLNLTKLEKKPITDIMPYYSKYRDIIEEKEPAPKKNFKLDANDSYVELLGKERKILYMGDLHIPFQVDWQIQTAVNRNVKADLAVCAEISDLYSLSRFQKTLSIPLEIEIDNIIRFYEYMSEHFDKIVIIKGNHANRIDRNMLAGIDPALYFLINTNMLEALARPFPAILITDSWYVQVNDAIFAHGEKFSKLDMKAGVNVYAFLREWQDGLGLKPFKVIVQGHIHGLGAAYRGSSFKILEGGTLCSVPDYAVEKMYDRPQTNGYVTVVQRDGESIFDLTREFVFPSEKYVPNKQLLERLDGN